MIARFTRRTMLGMTALLALAVCASCSRGGAEGDGGEGPTATVPVRVAAAELRTFTDVLRLPGQWRSSGDVAVPAPFAAVVESLGPRPGDPVRTGDVLGVLMTRESRAALRGAELLVREAHDGAARAEAERALALARRDLVRVPLAAPRSGVVARRGAEPGAEIAEGTELLAITPPDAVVFEARLPADHAGRVRIGDAATVPVEGDAARAASVTRVLPSAGAADQATLLWLAARPGDGSPPLLDRFGTAELRIGAARRSLAVPAEAVVENDLDGTSRIAVVGADSAATWVTVRPGVLTDGWLELKGAALRPGTRVVTEGQRGLPDGAHVKSQP